MTLIAIANGEDVYLDPPVRLWPQYDLRWKDKVSGQSWKLTDRALRLAAPIAAPRVKNFRSSPGRRPTTTTGRTTAPSRCSATGSACAIATSPS